MVSNSYILHTIYLTSASNLTQETIPQAAAEETGR